MEKQLNSKSFENMEKNKKRKRKKKSRGGEKSFSPSPQKKKQRCRSVASTPSSTPMKRLMSSHPISLLSFTPMKRLIPSNPPCLQKKKQRCCSIATRERILSGMRLTTNGEDIGDGINMEEKERQ